MDGLIPYEIPPDQAIAFQLQSASSERCLPERRGWTLQQLAETLRNDSAPDAVSCELPELQESSFLNDGVVSGAN